MILPWRQRGEIRQNNLRFSKKTEIKYKYLYLIIFLDNHFFDGLFLGIFVIFSYDICGVNRSDAHELPY
jgi:hypothetical protein